MKDFANALPMLFLAAARVRFAYRQDGERDPVVLQRMALIELQISPRD
jgi:hypothetical protein